MNESPTELYEALAQGQGKIPEDPRLIGALRQKVVEAQRSADLMARRDALAVCRAMRTRDGLEWMLAFASDPDPLLRREALQEGLDAEADGMFLVRAFLDDPDPDLCLEVVAVLTERADRTATTRVRGLMAHSDPRVRASAAHLLGFIAGPVVRPVLQRAVREDDDPQVQKAAEQAVERIDGLLSRSHPTRWSPAAAPTSTPAAPTPAAPPQAVAPPVAAAPSPAPTPAAAPRDAVASLRELGTPENPPAHAADLLAGLPADALAEAMSGYRTGGSPEHGVGAARAALALNNTTLVSPLRRWLADPSPRVRAAAVRALCGLGGPAVLPAASRLLADSDAQVVLAAIEALTSGVQRLEVPHMASTWLGPLRDSTDPAIATAAREALSSLGVD